MKKFRLELIVSSSERNKEARRALLWPVKPNIGEQFWIAEFDLEPRVTDVVHCVKDGEPSWFVFLETKHHDEVELLLQNEPNNGEPYKDWVDPKWT